ncbi:sulfate transporter family-domain-containing protein [Phycomyces nitens]|nr:sulfate transporter family-domain-containing protein [Phycomyces nitens]
MNTTKHTPDPSYNYQTRLFIANIPNYTYDYLVGLFPIATWIHRYNTKWFLKDLVAGITVGIVVVPQGMGYAKIACLPPQYGLYTAFVGLCVYCLFATSKDISIGPTAVMSLLVGQTITRVVNESSTITGPDVAAALSLFTGMATLAIGLLRLGILVDLVPGPAIAGFMTASALTITIGQIPKLLGIPNINTQEPTYQLLVHVVQKYWDARLDAVFGLLGLVWLYGLRSGCLELSKRYPRYSEGLFFVSIMRNGLLVIFGTIAAFIINIGKDVSPISILKDIPSGFNSISAPHIDSNLVSSIAGTLPSAIVILVLEHIAIGKAFGRINDYSINPNQEIIAIGFTNIWASFLGAYPSTGSFSRTAIKARSGVQTPFAGLFSGIVVLLSLYVLTPAFYYIPDAVLSAIVIHAVVDLVSRPGYIRQLAAVSVWELVIFLSSVIVTFFTSVEMGIYASVFLSVMILLFRIARPRVWVLGGVPALETQTAVFDHSLSLPKEQAASQPDVLPPGILLCRVEESITYLNSSYVVDKLVDYCKEHTRRNDDEPSAGRAWNDSETSDRNTSFQPRLHALILDFGSVNHLDSSGLQALVDIQTTLNRYSGHTVEFHFIRLTHMPIRRTLLVAGFGKPKVEPPNSGHTSSSQPIVQQETANYGSIQPATKRLLIGTHPFFHDTAHEAIRASLSSLSPDHNYVPNQSVVGQDVSSP